MKDSTKEIVGEACRLRSRQPSGKVEAGEAGNMRDMPAATCSACCVADVNASWYEYRHAQRSFRTVIGCSQDAVSWLRASREKKTYWKSISRIDDEFDGTSAATVD